MLTHAISCLTSSYLSWFMDLIFQVPIQYCRRRQWHPTPVLLPGKIPWMEEPGRLQSMGSLGVGLSDFTFIFHFHALEKEMATHSSLLAWRIPGVGEPGGRPSMGLHRVGHDWSDLAAAAFNIVLYSIRLYFYHQSHPQLCVCVCLFVFHFGSISSFFLKLFLHSSPVVYWAHTNLGRSSFSATYFCLFILFMGFSKQEYWSGLPFLSPADHILSDVSTMTHLSWVALHGMAHSFIELDKAVVHVINFISFCDCGFHSVCPLIDKDKRLMEASWLERLTLEETGSFYDGWGHAQ